jgi:predicted CoA-binding protein
VRWSNHPEDHIFAFLSPLFHEGFITWELKSMMMKKTIQAFLADKKVAIAGASANKDNFGRSIMTELTKLGYEVHPVNPKCEEIEGTRCVPSVKDLPGNIEGLILAVPSQLSEEIIGQCIGTPIRRVWMIKGVTKGAYSEKAHELCKENGIEVVYGFCPMMFFGKGAHRFHFWLRRNFTKLPEEYVLS